LLVGLDTYDDAGVYRLSDDLAIIQTVDFFTPIVDDPYSFGQIAAANAMSDIYAMGGVPLTAMNIICFPVKTMDISVLQEVLRGGLDKIKEAGALLVGGHSVEDDEFKYGLSVTGTVRPERVLTNRGARIGDHLIITKPVGTGIINTAIKGNLVNKEIINEVTGIMSTLNRAAAEEFEGVDISACTDVTGFGLLGHACEMIQGQEVGLRIYPDRVPLIEEVLNLARMGIVPGGTHRNRDFRKGFIIGAEGIEPSMMDILYDPQTSGGLLIAVKRDDSQGLIARLRKKGVKHATVIGEFIDGPREKITLFTQV
jgi:selenide,water dikinase